MSRENSTDDLSTMTESPIQHPSPIFKDSEAGPSRPRTNSTGYTYTNSISLSPNRPKVKLANIRTTSYSASSSLSANQIPSPVIEGSGKRIGLKRRISTPVVNNLKLAEEDNGLNVESYNGAGSNDGNSIPAPKREVVSRARSTSTSLMSPASSLGISIPTINVPTPQSAVRPNLTVPPSRPQNISIPKPGFSFTPASPQQEFPAPSLSTINEAGPTKSILERAYDTTESSLRMLTGMFRTAPTQVYPLHRRGSDEDSEKGYCSEPQVEQDECRTSGELGTASTSTTTRSSVDEFDGERDQGKKEMGKYWGMWTNGDTVRDDGYFSHPPTPPNGFEHEDEDRFGEALMEALPTPALSAHSLSRGRRASPDRARGSRGTSCGVRHTLSSWVRRGGSGETGAVLRDLGWTVGFLLMGFVSSAALALWLLSTLPITQLRHLPKSTTDLQLLSSEIRTYMSSSEIGWWHTILVLTFVGCWKHAWSVPGAIVLNILVGSLLSPIPALILLTIITATGSLGCYSLSRPLAPLIAVLFPKPLALVRAALTPETAFPTTSPTTTSAIVDTSKPKGSVWRRLLIMRAMGIVPWSGMNVACGVVGVDWKIFWLTTAAGSASWSYTTASIGDLLRRLAVAGNQGGDVGEGMEGVEGESLTGMLRDPVLLTKLVFLTGVTLIPVFLKRSNKITTASTITSTNGGIGPRISINDVPELDPILDEKIPIIEIIATETIVPTPTDFDVVSFGKTAFRTVGGVTSSGTRMIMLRMGKLGIK